MSDTRKSVRGRESGIATLSYSVKRERGEGDTILLVKEERWQSAMRERGVKYFRLLVILNSKTILIHKKNYDKWFLPQYSSIVAAYVASEGSM